MHFLSILEVFLRVFLGNGTISNKLLEDNATYLIFSVYFRNHCSFQNN